MATGKGLEKNHQGGRCAAITNPHHGMQACKSRVAKARLHDRFLGLFSDVRRYHGDFFNWTGFIAAPAGKTLQALKPDSTVG
jgi:hypothetical protein